MFKIHCTVLEPPTFTSVTLSLVDNLGQGSKDVNCQQSTAYTRNGFQLTVKWSVSQYWTEGNTSSVVPIPDYIADGNCLDNNCWKVGIVETSGTVTLVEQCKFCFTFYPLLG